MAERATEETYQPLSTQLALPELIEAAVRTGRAELAWESLERLSAMTTIEDSDWAKGLEARSRALLSEGHDAEHCYAEAVERLGRTPLRPELARAHLLYGEWLHREDRRVDARRQLRAAYDLFAAMGADAFTERARRELLTTGEKVRKREVEHPHRADPAGGAHRSIGSGWTHQSGDRREAVPQHPHHRMAPPQDIRQVGHRLPKGPRSRARRSPSYGTGVAAVGELITRRAAPRHGSPCSVPSSVTADQAGFVARGNHSG